MTIQEVIKELKDAGKVAYTGIKAPGKRPMTRHTFHWYIRNISKNKCKPSTIKEFFSLFGYDGDFNKWVKHEKERI